MIRDIEGLSIFESLCKFIKKPIIAVYPDGRVLGTDESFCSLNMIISDKIMSDIIDYNLEIPYIIICKEFTSFFKDALKDYNSLLFNQYSIENRANNSSLVNNLHLNFDIERLYCKAMEHNQYPIIYRQDDIQNINPDMFKMKASDGAKMYTIDGKYIMTSFNAIHPVNKSDKVDLIIRDYDYYSYYAEFIIYKKKEKYELHEFLRFMKL